MGYSRIQKVKACYSILRNAWPHRMLTIKQANRLLFLQKKNKDLSQKSSFFCDQLKEKRKLSVLFQGVSTKYMVKLFARGKRKLAIQRIDSLIRLLERRLDVVLIRSLFCTTINEARQFILHGFVLINSIPVTTPSLILNNGDIISFYFVTSVKKNVFVQRLIKNMSFFQVQNNSSHLEINYNTLEIVYLYSPQNISYITRLDSDFISSFLHRKYLI